MAVETGLWQLAEWEGSGRPKLTYKPATLKPIETYLKMQKRFKHLNDEDIAEIQVLRDTEWDRIMKTYD